jgi:sugar transferase (PEP-CTERM system associated)
MYKLFGHYLPKTLFYLCLVESLIFLVWVNTGALFTERSFSVNVNSSAIPDAVVFTGTMLISMLAMGLYRRDLREKFQTLLLRLCMSLLLGIALLYFYFTVNREEPVTHVTQFASVVCAFICIIFCRFLLYRRKIHQVKRVLVLGAGNKAHRLARLRRKTDRFGIDVLGYIDMEDSRDTTEKGGRILKRVNGEPFNYTEFITRHGIDEIVVALDEQRNRLPARDIMEMKLQGVHVIDINTFLERQLGKIDLDTIQTSSFIFSDGFSISLLASITKRVLDIIVSGLLLTVTAPIMGLTALAIWLESGCRGTIIYRQERTGLNIRSFNILKFRSMQKNAEQDGTPVWAAANDVRVTRVGRIIRKTRIDELPQLINVLWGEMSLVGPRPERPQFDHHLTETIPFYRLRSCVKPGITGWAQICYPYGASVHDAVEKLQYDLYYIKHQNIFLDLLILLQTAAVILLCKGSR